MVALTPWTGAGAEGALERCAVGLEPIDVVELVKMAEEAVVVVEEQLTVSLWPLLLRGLRLGRPYCWTGCWGRRRVAVEEEEVAVP